MAHVKSTCIHSCGRSSAANVSADDQRRRRGECIGVRRRGLDDFAGAGGDSRADRGGHTSGTETQQQAMESPAMEECRKFRKKKKCKGTRPNDKLVVGPGYFTRRRSERAARSRSTNVDLSLKDSGSLKRGTTQESIYPPQRQRKSRYFADGSG